MTFSDGVSDAMVHDEATKTEYLLGKKWNGFASMDGQSLERQNHNHRQSQYPDDRLSQVVYQWMEQHIGDVTINESVTIHVDELLGYDSPTPTMISLALRAFVKLVGELTIRGMPVQPALSITLSGESHQVQASVPIDHKKLIQEWQRTDPPSLYMIHWDLPKYLLVLEQYHAPLPFELFDPPVEGVYTRYEEVRDADAMQNGWEFTRFVTARYYSSQYRQLAKW